MSNQTTEHHGRDFRIGALFQRSYLKVLALQRKQTRNYEPTLFFAKPYWLIAKVSASLGLGSKTPKHSTSTHQDNHVSTPFRGACGDIHIRADVILSQSPQSLPETQKKPKKPGEKPKKKPNPKKNPTRTLQKNKMKPPKNPKNREKNQKMDTFNDDVVTRDGIPIVEVEPVGLQPIQQWRMNPRLATPAGWTLTFNSAGGVGTPIPQHRLVAV